VNTYYKVGFFVFEVVIYIFVNTYYQYIHI